MALRVRLSRMRKSWSGSASTVRPRSTGATQRNHPTKLGLKALPVRQAILTQPLGKELRRREKVAQVVVDLGDREPERGEMVFLLQQSGEIELHRRELAPGGADLVAALGGRHDARGILRIGAERHHVGGHA